MVCRNSWPILIKRGGMFGCVGIALIVCLENDLCKGRFSYLRTEVFHGCLERAT